MNEIQKLWHDILNALSRLTHTHPSNTDVITAQKAEIASLAEHHGLVPEQKEAVKTLTETAAAVVPEPLPVAPPPEPAPAPAPAAAPVAPPTTPA